jgi:hypothetical protein
MSQLRERAVLMVVEHAGGIPSLRAALKTVAAQDWLCVADIQHTAGDARPNAITFSVPA